MLADWGITTEGKPAFIGLDAAAGESDDAWDGFLRDLGERGLACPLLVISDGAAGLIGAAERRRRAPGRQQDAGPAAGPAPRPPRPQPRGAAAAQPDRPFPAVSPPGQSAGLA